MDISYNDKKRAKNTRKFEQGGYTRAREDGYTRQILAVLKHA